MVREKKQREGCGEILSLVASFYEKKILVLKIIGRRDFSSFQYRSLLQKAELGKKVKAVRKS